jgi:hypothetical protein
LITFMIAGFIYLKIVLLTQDDEKTTFQMIHMLPTSLINKNENVKQ